MTRTIDLLAWTGARIGKPPGWERIVRWFAPPERFRGTPAICLERDGMAFVAQPWVPLGWHVAMFGTYEPELRSLMRALLPAGGVAIDVGANVGWHTLLMARLAGANGRVLAVEANPSVRQVLDRNIALNRFSNVEVVPVIVSDHEGAHGFFSPPAEDQASGDGYVVMGNAAQSNVIQVESRRLDTIAAAARLERVDFLKIDVEGWEWPALQGAEETIARFRPNIVFEYNDEYVSRGGGTPEAFTGFLARHRYQGFAIGRNWASAIEAGHWPSCANVLAVPGR